MILLVSRFGIIASLLSPSSWKSRVIKRTSCSKCINGVAVNCMLIEVIASFSNDSNYSTRDLLCMRICFRIDINYFVEFDKNSIRN